MKNWEMCAKIISNAEYITVHKIEHKNNDIVNFLIEATTRSFTVHDSVNVYIHYHEATI